MHSTVSKFVDVVKRAAVAMSSSGVSLEESSDWSHELREAIAAIDAVRTFPAVTELSPGDIANFETLRAAAVNDDLALVLATRKSDGVAVALVCAMGRDADGNYCPAPLAVMVEGNPYELFDDPTGFPASDDHTPSFNASIAAALAAESLAKFNRENGL